jgi:GNAT superfamily N-acetyltransferase
MTDLDGPLPPGYRMVPARTTYLEMPRNEVAEPPAVPAGFRVERWERPPLDEYRALFRAVGVEWGWTGRELLSDGELRALLDGPAIEIYRLVDDSGDAGSAGAGDAAGSAGAAGGAAGGAGGAGGAVAGFAELEREPDGNVEIVYFGLTPGYIGHGLGGVLLRWTVDRAWRATPAAGFAPTRRLWLHTCDFDSETAIGFYRHCGFAVYDERVQMEPYPEDFLGRLGR